MGASGHVRVPRPEEPRHPKTVIYVRVSSHPQKDDLDRQSERFEMFLTAKGRVIDVANPSGEHGTDVMADFLATTYSFAPRMHGRRGTDIRASSAVKRSVITS